MTTEAIRLKRAGGSSERTQGEGASLRRSLQGVAVSGLTVLGALALLSHDVAGPPSSNLIGPVGHHLAGGLLFLLGMPALLLPLVGALAAFQLFRHREVWPASHVLAGSGVLMLSSCLLLGLAGAAWSLTAYPAGGLLGMMLGDVLSSFFGVAGASVIGATGAFAGTILVLGIRPVDAAEWLRTELERRDATRRARPASDCDVPDADEERAPSARSGRSSTQRSAEPEVADEPLTEEGASSGRHGWRGLWERWTRRTEDTLPEMDDPGPEPRSGEPSSRVQEEGWSFGDELDQDQAPAWTEEPAGSEREVAAPQAATASAGSTVSQQGRALSSGAAPVDHGHPSGTQRLALVSAAPANASPQPEAPEADRPGEPEGDDRGARRTDSAGRSGADLHLWKRIKARFQGENEEAGTAEQTGTPMHAGAPPFEEDNAADESWTVDEQDLVEEESVGEGDVVPVGSVASSLQQGPAPPAPPTPQPHSDLSPSVPVQATASASAGALEFGPSIQPCASLLQPKAASDLDRAERECPLTKPQAPWEFPPLSFLSFKPRSARIDHDALREQAARLEQVFADFKIKGTVTNIRPGPVITMYEFEPEAGKRLTTIANLADNVKMALRAESVRIIAPLPGKGCVGIEVPNDARETVYLKEVLAHETFRKNKSPLVMGLGTDIEGNPVVADLAKMPHLLVAGTTGSGKSVAVNAMLTSILFRASPEDVKLILIDPKQLELAVYGEAPHLLLPVVTDPSKAATALNWAVVEMERRYTLMSEMRVRNLSGYNERVKELQDRFGAWIDPEIEPEALTPEERLLQETEPDGRQRHRHMPYLVVVIDEFADLMMVAGKEVEISVARLAQKARAAGIHVILATQRPSVDVLTGLIKANFPTRMSFRLISGTDSRTVLDAVGAENLLGMGDMLFRPPGATALSRVHGAWLEEREIEQVVHFLRKQREPEFDESILDAPAAEGGEGAMDDEPEDDRYGDAVEIVREAGFASISMIQRKLRIGYNRSARIVEQMEREGIVGPSSGGSGRREVLI